MKDNPNTHKEIGIAPDLKPVRANRQRSWWTICQVRRGALCSDSARLKKVHVPFHFLLLCELHNQRCCSLCPTTRSSTCCFVRPGLATTVSLVARQIYGSISWRISAFYQEMCQQMLRCIPTNPYQPIFSSATRCPGPQWTETFSLQNDLLPRCLWVSCIPLWGCSVCKVTRVIVFFFFFFEG